TTVSSCERSVIAPQAFGGAHPHRLVRDGNFGVTRCQSTSRPGAVRFVTVIAERHSFNGPSPEADKEVCMAERRPAPAAGGTAILRDADVGRVIDRIAHQIIETVAKGGFDVALLGIPTRGVPLAYRLAARIEVFA